MPTTIKIVEAGRMRYGTCGDWYPGKDGTIIEVLQTGNPDYNFLIAMHEMIESYLCSKAGIDSEQVDEWDLGHLEVEDPGMEPGCPYQIQHIAATEIEVHLSGILGVDWNKYCEAIDGNQKERITEESPKSVSSDV